MVFWKSGVKNKMISNKFKKNGLSLMFVFFAMRIVASWNPELADKDIILATVNGIPVTLSDAKAETAKEERYIKDNFKGKIEKEKLKKMRRRAVDDIILRRLISEKFDKSGYKVPAQLIEKMMDKIADDLAGGDRKLLASKARQAGLTLAKLQEQARKRVATMMLINARCYMNVFVTPKEVFDYYKRNRDKFTVPGKIHLQAIYLKSIGDDDDNIIYFALKLKDKLKNADEEKFSKMVEKYSMGPNREKGGDLGWISFNRLRLEFKNSITGLNVGDIAGPLKTPEGYYFLRIKETKKSETKTFNELKLKIREKLENEMKETNYQKYIKKIRSDAIVRYFDTLKGPIGDNIRQFYSQTRKENK